MAASATDDMLRQIREDRDLTNLGKGGPQVTRRLRTP
jgi:hypothetical protein